MLPSRQTYKEAITLVHEVSDNCGDVQLWMRKAGSALDHLLFQTTTLELTALHRIWSAKLQYYQSAIIHCYLSKNEEVATSRLLLDIKGHVRELLTLRPQLLRRTR